VTDTLSIPETPTPVTIAPAARPRIRVGAVLWGLLLLTAGGAALWIATSPERRADARAAVLGLDGFGWTITAVLVVGGAITLIALAAVIRSVQARLGPGRRRGDTA
jgi:TRAP-type C4-dicarboxylate transport system permease small subunit